MTFAKYSIVLFCSFGIATIGLVAAQESPAELASNVVPGTREIHVSPQGNDENDGSAANPLASLEAAQPRADGSRNDGRHSWRHVLPQSQVGVHSCV
jgi:hypothetical protein